MKCKKCIGLMLAILILVSNIGWSFTMHYCGEKLASISVQTLSSSNQSVKSCCAQKVLKKDNCCKNKKVQIEKKSDQATLKVFSFEPYIAYLVSENKAATVISLTTILNKPIASYYCNANAPPLFKLYRQYIFYA